MVVYTKIVALLIVGVLSVVAAIIWSFSVSGVIAAVLVGLNLYWLTQTYRRDKAAAMRVSRQSASVHVAVLICLVV